MIRRRVFMASTVALLAAGGACGQTYNPVYGPGTAPAPVPASWAYSFEVGGNSLAAYIGDVSVLGTISGSISGYLPLTGGTLTGILNTDGINSLNAANITVPTATNIWFGSNSNAQNVNEFTTASATFPEAAKETIITANTGSANAGSAFKVGDFVALNCSSNSANCYGLNTVVQANAGFNSLLTGHEIDLDFNAGRASGSFGSANAAYNLVLAGTTASSSYSATAALWITGAGTNYNTMWYDGIYISPGPTSNGFEDASNSTTSYTIAGNHTTGLDSTNATLTFAINAKAGQYICLNNATDCLSYNAGVISASSGAAIQAAGFITPPVAFASLPASPVAGERAAVNNAATCTFNTSVAGGGSTFCPVIYNGSAWVGG